MSDSLPILQSLIHFNFNPQVPKTNGIAVITLNSCLGNSAVHWAS